MSQEHDELIERLRQRARDSKLAYSMLQETHEDLFEFYPPLLQEELMMIEKWIGFDLPSLMRDVYSQVANGGFGPGYGLTGLTDDGSLDFNGMNAIDLYMIFGSDHNDSPNHLWWWPRRVIPICDYDNGVVVCIDCSTEEGCMIRRQFKDTNDRRDDFTVIADSFEQWLQAWLEGRLI